MNADMNDDPAHGHKQHSAQQPSSAGDPAALPALVLVSTPIGNLQDLSPRAKEALAAADVILCEDTRTSATLLRAHGIATRTQALHEHNEQARIEGLVAAMQGGTRYALISDAGTPLVSDPGYRLVRAAIAAGLKISGIPGPNAALLALTLSGLPPHPFLFTGFLPPKSAARRAAFAQLRGAELAGLSCTHVFYEAPHRLGDFLADAAATLGPRQAAVCRELTKRFEEARRGTLEELAAHYAAHEARGEICVVIGPAEAGEETAQSLDEVLRAALAGMSVKDAAAAVATALGLPKKQVYQRALELGRET
jgi:16S rRNA (cytidine1402-2'-O)-methyltransferase